MNPQTLRLSMVALGATCFVAAGLLPTMAAYLVPAGVGLLAWAKSAPGDAPKGAP